jgi:hypothetical protein
MTGSPNCESFTRGQASALPLSTQGGSRMRESRSYGSVRGTVSNDWPYREPRPEIRDRARKGSAPFSFRASMLFPSLPSPRCSGGGVSNDDYGGDSHDGGAYHDRPYRGARNRARGHALFADQLRNPEVGVFDPAESSANELCCPVCGELLIFKQNQQFATDR